MPINGINSNSFDSLSINNTLNKQMQPAADLLGMTVSQMQAAEKGGRTLSELAKAKGVREADLESAISDGLMQNTPAGGTALTVDQAATLATAIATGQAPSTALTFTSNLTLLDYIQQDPNNSSKGNNSNDVLNSIDTADASDVDSHTQALSTTAANTSKLSLDALAKALGTDTATLQQQLQSGDTTSLAQELTNAYGTTAGLQFDASL